MLLDTPEGCLHHIGRTDVLGSNPFRQSFPDFVILELVLSKGSLK